MIETPRFLKGSLHLRSVDTGSCGACEAEIQALANPYYDLHRFSFFFTSTPKHADALLITGPGAVGMAEPLRQALASVPAPRLLIAVGSCAVSGGLFRLSPLTTGLPMPPTVSVPGCPPTPDAILDGLLLSVGRRKAGVES